MRYRVVVCPHPIDDAQRTIEDLPLERSLAQLLRERTPERLDPDAWVVHVNGHRLEDIEGYQPMAGDVVTARLAPRDPGTLFVIFAALAAAVGASTAVAYTFATFATLGTLYAASRALQRAFLPDLPKQAGVPAAKPFYSIQGGRNQLLPHGAIQQHYGRLRTTPDLLGTFVSSVDAAGKQSVRALFCVGHGHYDVSDVRFGTQSIEALNPSRLVVYNGTTGETPIEVLGEVFAANIFEESLQLQLRNEWTSSDEFVRETQEHTTAFEIAIVFPQGLYGIALKGDHVKLGTYLVVRYRAAGSSDPWIPIANEFLKAYTQNKIVRNYRVEVASGQYEISVQLKGEKATLYTRDRGGTGSVVSVFVGDATWLSLRSQRAGISFDEDYAADLTLLGLEVAASELANGALDLISVEASRLLPVYDTGSETWPSDPADFVPTRNPAWAFAHEHRDAGVPDDELDAAEIARWADFCDDEGWTCDLSQTDPTTLEDSVRTIASCAQASPIMRGSLFSVTWDEPKTPVAAFGPANMRALTISYAAQDPVHAVRARFSNVAESDGKLDERTVYLDGHTVETATEFETLDLLNGLTTPELVERHVRLEYAKRRLRPAIYTWEAGLDGLTVQIGDCALLAYSGALLGDAQSTTTGYSTRDAGAHIDEVFVHPALRVEAGREYTLRVRTRRDEGEGFRILELPLVNPLTAGTQKLSALEVEGDVDVPTYLDDDDVEQIDALEGQPAFLGEPSAIEVIVLSVERLDHHFCRIRAVDRAPALLEI